MAKFNRGSVRPAVTSPVTTETTPTGRTHEGAPGYKRDAKSELFLLAVANMVGEDTFYETSGNRDNRYRDLVHTVAVADPEWTTRFLAWLRTGANMRSAALVGGLEAAKALRDAGLPGGRQITASVLQRADEPGEAVAYWLATYGRRIPKPVKRGIADAATRLYTEYTLLKYDTGSHSVRFGDVLDLTHPATDDPGQAALYVHALDRRHGRDTEPAGLPMIDANQALRAAASDDPTVLLDTDRLRAAGMTWEDALSLAGDRVNKARLWEAVIPSMGYMALLRNLRNFDQAGVSDNVAATVASRLADPRQVARSRQMPMRFLSAYRATPSLRWAWPLEQALNAALVNVPHLDGRTLILVDTSGSMGAPFSRDGTLMRWDAAAMFGIALAHRCAKADVVSFSSAQRYYGDRAGAHTKVFPVTAGGSLLSEIHTWNEGGWFLGGGTDTPAALRQHYEGHDRVVIVTDEQVGMSDSSVSQAIPERVPMYTWNLAGYQHGHAPSGTGTRHTFGGLTDAAFRMIPLLEAGRDAAWPWE